jgi:hypothetical protein
MDEEIFDEGWKHLSKSKILPKQTLRWVALGLRSVCLPVHCVCMYVCMYIISVVVLQIYFSCAQIDNNQQVYEVQIQVPRCSSILKAGLHECQKLRPLHLGRCTGKHTDRSPKNIFATPPLILYTYIHIYTQYTFFLNGSLFMMALS